MLFHPYCFIFYLALKFFLIFTSFVFSYCSILPPMLYCSKFGLQVFLLSWFSTILSGCYSPNWSFPSWSFLYSHSFSLSAPSSLSLIFVFFKNLKTSLIAYRSASSSTSHCFSDCLYHWIPTLLKSFLKICRFACHFWHLVYKCRTDCSMVPHH